MDVTNKKKIMRLCDPDPYNWNKKPKAILQETVGMKMAPEVELQLDLEGRRVFKTRLTCEPHDLKTVLEVLGVKVHEDCSIN